MKLLCTSVNIGFEDIFAAGRSYPVIEKAPNGEAWNIQRVEGGTPTFVAKNSVFGTFEEVDGD